MDKTNPIDHPRTYAALMEASDADGAHEVCDLCAKLEEENARLREAVLKFSAVAVNIIRRRALLLPPESEMFEAACGELTLILTNPAKR